LQTTNTTTINNIDINITHGEHTSGTSTINNEEMKNTNFSPEILKSFPKAAMKGKARIWRRVRKAAI